MSSRLDIIVFLVFFAIIATAGWRRTKIPPAPRAAAPVAPPVDGAGGSATSPTTPQTPWQKWKAEHPNMALVAKWLRDDAFPALVPVLGYAAGNLAWWWLDEGQGHFYRWSQTNLFWALWFALPVMVILAGASTIDDPVARNNAAKRLGKLGALTVLIVVIWKLYGVYDIGGLIFGHGGPNTAAAATTKPAEPKLGQADLMPGRIFSIEIPLGAELSNDSGMSEGCFAYWADTDKQRVYCSPGYIPHKEYWTLSGEMPEPSSLVVKNGRFHYFVALDTGMRFIWKLQPM